MSSCVFCTSCEIFCCGFDNIVVVTVLPVYINSFCYSVIFEAFIQFTPKFIVAFLDKKSTLLYLLINSLKIDNSEC